MESWDHHRSRRHHPSFSSTLLDQIYLSIDEDSIFSGDPMRKKTHSDPHRRSDSDRSSSFVFLNHSSSCSSSSDSSCFSSDPFYPRSRSSRSPPRPIRTVEIHRSGVKNPNGGAKQELGSFLRKKSKALRMYSELKKSKQPISPGGRLASFLNSLFTAGNAKKPKKATNLTAANAAKEQTSSALSSSSTCSSASSFSRSCLSKTASSSVKSKRSVRFCPDSVIPDEHETTHKSFDVMEENRRVIEAAKDLLRTYRKNKDLDVDVINIHNDDDDDDGDGDDDDASYASSDLFELDNLSEIGIEKYIEELPVYETTHLQTNRAIASGLIL